MTGRMWVLAVGDQRGPGFSRDNGFSGAGASSGRGVRAAEGKVESSRGLALRLKARVKVQALESVGKEKRHNRAQGLGGLVEADDGPRGGFRRISQWSEALGPVLSIFGAERRPFRSRGLTLCCVNVINL